jgi:hypothetical protein
MGNLNGEDIVKRLSDRKVAYPIIVINGCGPGREEFKHVQKETTAIHPETGELVPKPLESHG